MLRILFSYFFFTFNAFSVEIHLWEKIDSDFVFENLTDVKLQNRASCAKASKLPTTSAFILVDNSIPAKAVYRISKLLDVDADTYTKESIVYFRKRVIEGARIIHKKLVSSELPLLPYVEEGEDFSPSRYTDILRTCYENHSCPQLNQYMDFIWSNSNKYKADELKDVLSEIDNFRYFDQYIKNSISSVKQKCFRLKKFSPVQANLYGTKPTRAVLQRTAESLNKFDQYIVSCDDLSIENLVSSSYQLEVDVENLKAWNKVGFSYWNSLKLYLFYYINSLELFDSKYEKILRGSDLRDSIFIVSNTCKSIENPVCNNEYLSKNTVREMAKTSFEKNALDLDVFDAVVDGAQDDLLNDPFTSVNTDILNLKDEASSELWAERFFNNMHRTKFYVKTRLNAALSFYNILQKNDKFYRISHDISAYYSRRDLSSNTVKNDIYYMCTEAYFASHEEFSYVKDNISYIKKSNFLASNNLFYNNMNLEEIIAAYENVLLEVRGFCNSLDQKSLFGDDFIVKREGFLQWYIDKTFQKSVKSESSQYLKDLNKEAYLTLKSNDSVVCYSPSSCARNLIKHVLNISRAVHYSKTLWGTKSNVRSGDLFNPYAERVACKVYDPYYKTKAILTNFVSDLAQAGLSSMNAGFLYTKMRLEPGRVTSFNKLINDGEILFETKYEKQKIKFDLMLDFGPLLGVPCAISLGERHSNGYDLFHFTGISVGTCQENEQSTLTVYSASDMQNVNNQNSKNCISCRLNFESVGKSLSAYNSVFGTAFYVVRAFFNVYKGLKDPHNIIKDWTVNFKHLKNTFERFGYIPKRCVKYLSNAQACLGNREEESAVAFFQSKYRNEILGEKKRGSYVYLKVEGCLENIRLKINNFGDVDRERIPKSCSLVRR